MKEFLKKHTYAIVTTVTVLVLLGFSYQVMAFLIGLREEPEKQPPKIPIRSVTCKQVEYGPVQSPVYGNGRVVSTQDVVISTEVRGKIFEGDIPFKKGQTFRKNDVLIRIDSGNADFSLRSRKSEFLKKIAGILPDLKIDYPESYDRWYSFFQSIDMVKKLPDLPAIESSQEKIFVASRSILSDFYSIKSDEITLDKYTIIAPFDGAIEDVLVEVGAISNPGSTLARIIRTDSLELEVPIESDNTQWIEIGDVVDVTTESGSTEWTGKVVRKSKFVEPDTQSTSIFVRLTNNGKLPLFKGQYLKAVFPGKNIGDVMEIPRNAVFNFNEVFVVDNGRLAKREITIHKVNETTLVFSGLETGTELVVEPLVNTMENSRVEIIR